MKIHASLASHAFCVLLALLTARAVLAQIHDDGSKGAAGGVANLIDICGVDNSQEKVRVPAELAPFVPSDATAVEWHRADLNLDGRLDYFLVIEHHCDERTLLLVVRTASGALTLAASSDHIITCRSCRGQYGGYVGAHVRRGSFTIDQQNSTGSCGMGETLTFAWSTARHTWVVSAADRLEYCDSPAAHSGKESIGVALQDYQSHLQTEGG
jgi:hypothetical protein